MSNKNTYFDSLQLLCEGESSTYLSLCYNQGEENTACVINSIKDKSQNYISVISAA